jgi:fluoride ion exporter CrcB/FEX
MAPPSEPSSSAFASAMNESHTAKEQDSSSLEPVGTPGVEEDAPKLQNTSLHAENDDSTTTEPSFYSNSSVDQSREIFEQRFGKPTRQAIREFFYKRRPTPPPPPQEEEPSSLEDDLEWVQNFWKTFDDIIFISLFTQLGMVFRLAAAKWFSVFDNTFRPDSALFVNLPLNCLACWVLGFLGDGPSLMSMVETRFTPQDLQQAIQDEVWNAPISPRRGPSTNDGTMRRRLQREPTQWTRPRRVGNAELRQVQLLALERRIRASPCLVLFPVSKQDIDVMDHYVNDHSSSFCLTHDHAHESATRTSNDNDLENGTSTLSLMASDEDQVTLELPTTPTNGTNDSAHHHHHHRRRRRHSLVVTSTNTTAVSPPHVPSAQDYDSESTTTGDAAPPPGVDRDLDQILHDVSANISTNIQDATSNLTTNIKRMRRVSLAEGWDVGTTAQAMSDDLLLGLRDGFCGALSTFSSWSSSMVNLLRNGQVSDAVVGYVIGIQLPIVAYRFGQNMAVYLFIWRSRRETRKDERRGGYGIRLPQDDDEEDEEHSQNNNNNTSTDSTSLPQENEMPSVRAIATAIFMLLVVTQLTSLVFFNDPAQHSIALSLFFSPLGVLTRWRISRYNRLIAGFPIGTFISNMLGCALSGSLGQLLAGNPGPRERIVLQSLIRGFAGSLSSVSALVVEVLAGTDPILFRFDGFTYAACTIFWGMVIGFIVSTTLDWTEKSVVAAPAADAAATDVDVGDRNLTALFFFHY